MYRVQFGSQVIDVKNQDDLADLISIADRVTFKSFNYENGFDQPAVYIDMQRVLTITMSI